MLSFKNQLDQVPEYEVKHEEEEESIKAAECVPSKIRSRRSRRLLSTTLDEALAAERVTTGRSSLGTLPRATLSRRSRRTVCRTNSGDTIEEVAVDMCLQHESFDNGIKIVHQFVAAKDECLFFTIELELDEFILKIPQ